MRPQPSIAEIEDRLNALRVPAQVVERHIKRLQKLRRIPHRRWIKVRKPGRHPSWRWKEVVET